jgi:uncharacterized protein YcfJ
MRRKTIPLLLLSLTSAAAAAADFVDTAQVVSATPIIDRVTETRQDCANVPASQPPAQGSIAAPIIGGVAGAILGNQVGRGSGRTAATAAGAIAGAVVGNSIGNQQARAEQQASPRCRTIESTRDVVNGYNVVYRYNGRDVATVLPYNPGPALQVSVSVIQSAPPAAGYPAPAMASSAVPPPPGGMPPAPPAGAVAPNPPLTPASNVYRY